VLTALLAHPSNRTAAAEAAHLSRSVFYQRIALLEDLLGVDFDDGEQVAALQSLARTRSPLDAPIVYTEDSEWKEKASLSD
jgi:purine catabolism regulator